MAAALTCFGAGFGCCDGGGLPRAFGPGIPLGIVGTIAGGGGGLAHGTPFATALRVELAFGPGTPLGLAGAIVGRLGRMGGPASGLMAVARMLGPALPPGPKRGIDFGFGGPCCAGIALLLARDFALGLTWPAACGC